MEEIDIENMLDEGLPDDLREHKKQQHYEEKYKTILDGTTSYLLAWECDCSSVSHNNEKNYDLSIRERAKPFRSASRRLASSDTQQRITDLFAQTNTCLFSLTSIFPWPRQCSGKEFLLGQFKCSFSHFNFNSMVYVQETSNPNQCDSVPQLPESVAKRGSDEARDIANCSTRVSGRNSD